MERAATNLATCSDSQLIRAAREDPAAFEVLYERHAALLRRWLFAKVGDVAVAHDLLAETFAQAWCHRRRFRGRDDRSGVAWLYAIARNLVRQHHKRGRIETAGRERLGMAIPSAGDGGLDDLHERIDADGLSAGVRQAFTELTAEQQRAIGYRVIDQLSYDEVAARLRCSTPTARSHVFRGLRALRTVIDKGARP